MEESAYAASAQALAKVKTQDYRKTACCRKLQNSKPHMSRATVPLVVTSFMAAVSMQPAATQRGHLGVAGALLKLSWRVRFAASDGNRYAQFNLEARWTTCKRDHSNGRTCEGAAIGN